MVPILCYILIYVFCYNLQERQAATEHGQATLEIADAARTAREAAAELSDSQSESMVESLCSAWDHFSVSSSSTDGSRLSMLVDTPLPARARRRAFRQLQGPCLMIPGLGSVL